VADWSRFIHTTLSHIHKETLPMGLVRTGVAGLAAWKWGGGIIGTILVFVLVYWLLGVLF